MRSSSEGKIFCPLWQGYGKEVPDELSKGVHLEDAIHCLPVVYVGCFSSPSVKFQDPIDVLEIESTTAIKVLHCQPVSFNAVRDSSENVYTDESEFAFSDERWLV